MNDKLFIKEFNRLNDEQKEAVETIEGPVMIIAGPGTGKTQIMAMRIANILRQVQVNASNVLALTFTESGVFALKQRLLKIIGPASYGIHIHTFHSFCNEIILTFPEKFLFSKKINQLDDLEQILIIQKIISRSDIKLIKPLKSPFHYQGTIIKAINDLKQENISPEKLKKAVKSEVGFIQNNEDNYHQKGIKKGELKAEALNRISSAQKNIELAEIYKNYQKELEKSGSYDYADMILFVLKAFRQDEELLAFYQEKFQYILVDEYQDTNSAQNEVVKALAEFQENPNIFVVGDDEQSIYRFQGAALENILYFTTLYPEAKIIVLKKNYRSSQNILNVSRAVITNNQNQIFNRLNIEKALESELKNLKGEIVLGEFNDGQTESFYIAREIRKLIKKGVSPSDIAVIYRQHHDAADLPEFLAKLDIPYRLEIGENILENPEINKILKILRVLDTGPKKQEEDQALFEMMHFSFFALSDLDIYKISHFAGKMRLSLQEVINNDKILEELDLEKKKAVIKFRKILFSLISFSQTHTFAESFEYIINETGFLKYLLKQKSSFVHLHQLNTLFQKIKLLNLKDSELNISRFRKYLDLLEENGLSIKATPITVNFDGIHLLTAHKAKGLEFKIVFIMKCIDKNWGSRSSRDLIKLPAGLLKIQNDPDEKDEEERRLFYVALTRAKEKIYLTYSLKYGDSENVRIPSKFLIELPESHIKRIKATKFDQKILERLQLIFKMKKWEPVKAVSDFIKAILEDYHLSATSLNNYLDCPQKFFLDNLLRVPRTKTFDQAYGTAVHKAFEMFYRQQIKDLALPTKEKLLSFFKEALKDEILTDNDLKRSISRGQEILSAYYDYYIDYLDRTLPIAVEYSFTPHRVRFGEIPVTGKIDKIELIDKTAKQVRIIDYKTSAPKTLNEILGKTKGSDFSLINQAYFYKLLAEQDPFFDWQIKEVEFDFLSPQKDKFNKIKVPLDEEGFNEFKKVVQRTYKDILDQKFICNSSSCEKFGRKCLYFDYCQRSA